VIEAAKPPFCITHKAGHMLVTDRLNEEFREARSGTLAVAMPNGR